MNYFSFCLYDRSVDPENLPLDKYLDGFIKNTKLINKYFTNFTIILYVDNKISNQIIKKREITNNPLIVIKYIDHDTEMVNSFAFHRYDIFKELFDIVIVRDCDQILTNLDILMLQQWILDPDSKYLLYMYKNSITEFEFDGICTGGFATKDKRLNLCFTTNIYTKQLTIATTLIKNSSKEASLDEKMIWRFMRMLGILKFVDKCPLIDTSFGVTYVTLYKPDSKNQTKLNMLGSNMTMFE